jgi:hypothetical protein
MWHGRKKFGTVGPNDGTEQTRFATKFQIDSPYGHFRFASDPVQANFVIAMLQEQIGSAGDQMISPVSGISVSGAACGAMQEYRQRGR